MAIPEKYRDIVHTAKIAQSVSSLEETIKLGDGSNLSSVWPPDVIATVGSGIYEDMNCLSAWRSISRGDIAGILDTVRNRVLNFALAIEKAAPNAGDGFDKNNAISDEKVSHVFQTHVYGNVGNIAQASRDFAQNNIQIIQGDFNSLSKFLREAGLEDGDISELKEALENDDQEKKPGLGQKVTDWIGRMIGKASSGIWHVGTTIAAQLLTSAISQYLGLPS